MPKPKGKGRVLKVPAGVKDAVDADLKRAHGLAQELLQKHGLAAQGWSVNWTQARSTAGSCSYATKAISLSLHLVGGMHLDNGGGARPTWEEVRETILHEVAHALAGKAAAHGPAWKAIAKDIGCNAERTHHMDLAAKRYQTLCSSDACDWKGRDVMVRRWKLRCPRCKAPVAFRKL